MHSMKYNFARIAFACLLLTVGFASMASAQPPAATSTFRFFVDADPAISCAINTTVGTPLSGIDQIVTVVVSTGATPTISSTSRQVCSGGVFNAAAPPTSAMGPVPGPPGNLSTIETSAPLAALPSAAGVRVYFDSIYSGNNSPQSRDELLTLDGTPVGGGIIVQLIAGDIPTLGEWGLILLALLLSVSAFVVMRRRGQGRRAAAGLLLVFFALGAGVAWAAITIMVDGNPGDWGVSGVTVATDANADAQPNADIVKGYGVVQVDSSNIATLFLRIDVRFTGGPLTNNPPTVNPATFSIPENSANGTNVGTVTFTDPDAGQTHTFAITAGNLGGAFAIDPSTGQITVANTTALDFETTPTFSLTVQVTDNGTPIQSGSATVTVNLTNVNEAPVVQADTFIVGEDAAVGSNVGTVVFTDSDLGQTHTFAITAGNTGGAFAINPSTGQITVAAPLNATTNPTYSLTVQVTDNGTPALSGSATITVNVTNVNHTPVVNPATFSLAENSPNATSVGTVTFTDSDAGQTHTFSITAGNTGGAFAIDPSTGAITVANSSAVDFETNPTFSLMVQVTDNGSPALSGSATITVNLTDVSETPMANAQSVTTNEDTPLVITLTGSDGDGDPLTFAVGTGPTNGTLSAITPINATSAQVTYTPGTDFNGADSFTFTVNDGTVTSPAATVSITVNGGSDTPVANAQSVTTPEDTPLVITLTGSDADGDPLTFAVGTGPTNGTLSAITPINATSAQVTYTPGANFNGADSFTFTVNDGTATSPAATVSITVNSANDIPVATAQSVTTPEDTPLVIMLTGSDADSDPLTFAIGTGPTNGTLSAITPINATSAQVTYTPGANFNGADNFTFTVNDGTATSPAATVSIIVNSANDIPVATAQSVTTPEDTPLVITLTGSDADGDPLTFAVGTGPTNGTLSAITPINATSAQVTYTPGANFNGADSFTFTVNDGTATSPAATVSITVNSANDIPVATAQSVTTPEDTPLVITLTGSDADSDPLTFAIGTGPTNGTLSAITPINATSAQVTYTPGANFNGADNFTFTVNDGTATSPAATVSITVSAVNDTPVATAQSVTTPEDTPLVITLTGSDADGNPLTFASGSPTNGTLSAITPINATSAQVTYTPGPNFNGADSFTFTVNDGTATSLAATVSITVSAVNDTPVANAQSVTTNEDTPLVITLTGSDGDGDPLAFASAIPMHGTLSAITPINATSAQVTYTPNPNYNGADSFTFTVNDGTVTSPAATVSITVNAVNDIPVANAQSVTTNEDTPLVITLTGSDGDGDPLAFASAAPMHGTLSAITPINATSAQVTYTPNLNYNGADSFTFTVNDGTAPSPAATVSITINAVNDPPMANPDAADITEEAPNVPAANTVSGNVLTNDVDPDSSLIVSAVAGGSVGSPRAGMYGSVTINSNGSYTYTLDDTNPTVNALAPGGTLVESFGYTASDGALTNSSTLTVTIHGADDPATPDNDAQDFIGNTQLEVDRDTASTPEVIANTPANPPALGVLDGDVDPDGGSPITIAGIVGCGDLTAPFDCVLPGQGTVSLQADGSFSFIPEAGDTDPTASFQYTLVGNPVPATVTLTRFERVWFVDPTAPAGGNGTSALPFNSLDSIDGGADSDQPSDYIFIHDGTLNLSGPMPMEDNQHLIGQGVALSIPVSLNGNPSPTVLVPATTMPDVTNATGNAITIGQGIPIEIRGLSLASTTGNAIDLTSTAAFTGSGTLAIADNEIRGAGAEGVDINLNAGTTGTLAVNFTNNTWDPAGTHTGNGFDARTAAAGANLRVNFSNNTNVLATGVGASGVVIDGSGGGTLTITGFANNSVHQNTMGSGMLITSATFDADPATAGFQQVSGGATVIGASGPTNGVGGSGINMSTVSGDLAFTDLDIFADGGQALRIAGTGAVNTVAGTGTRVTVGAGVAIFEATGGPAVDVNNATVDLQPTSIKSTNSTTTGVSLVNVSDGTTPAVFSAGAGAITTAAGATGPTFNVSGGNADISYAGTITNNSASARAVSLTTWAGDDLNDDITLSGAIDENGAGILVNGNGGTCAGDTDGCPITFSGGMDIDTTTGEGFAATSNGGSVRLHVTGTNAIDSISATALRVTGTTIGNSNLNFQHISSGNNTAAADPANGIVLSNTGSSGGLIVTGNGGACTEGSSTCTGGWIQNMTGGDDSGATPGGTGIVLNNTANVSLTRMRINDTSNYGIRGTSVSGFTFTNGVVDGANGTNVSTPFNEGSLVFFGVTGTSSGMTGTSSITNSTIMGGRQRNIAIDNSVGTLNLTVNGNTIKRTSDAAGDDGFFLEADTTANVTLGVTNNTFARHGGDHINVTMLNNAVVDLTITGNTLHGNYAGTPEGNHPIGLSQGIFIFGATFDGTCTYNISNNGTVGVPFRGNRQVGAIHVNKGSGTGTFSGRIENNVIGDPALTGSGSSEAFGIIVGARGAGGSHTTLINNNQVRQYFDRGIVLEAGEGSAALNATVTNNTVSNFADAVNSLHGIHSDNGILAADTNAVCLQISGNSVATAGNEPAGGADIRLRRGSNTTVRLPGVAGATNANATTLLQANNPTATTITVTGNGFSSGAACPLP